MAASCRRRTNSHPPTYSTSSARRVVRCTRLLGVCVRACVRVGVSLSQRKPRVWSVAQKTKNKHKLVGPCNEQPFRLIFIRTGIQSINFLHTDASAVGKPAVKNLKKNLSFPGKYRSNKYGSAQYTFCTLELCYDISTFRKDGFQPAPQSWNVKSFQRWRSWTRSLCSNGNRTLKVIKGQLLEILFLVYYHTIIRKHPGYSAGCDCTTPLLRY